MAAPRYNEKTPPGEYLAALYDEQGMNYGQIAKLYGVSRQAVTERVKNHRARVAAEATDESPLPWPINPKDAGSKMAIALIAIDRRNAGGRLPEDHEQLANELLALAERRNIVFDYDWDEGFLPVPRVPADGTSLVRRPRAKSAAFA